MRNVKLTAVYRERTDKVEIFWKKNSIMNVLKVSERYDTTSPSFIENVLKDNGQQAQEIVKDFR